MFESIVVDLLNRFLGDYVENLDRSQLKLAIWGGDITLKSLDIKQNALNELDLPVKVVSGHLGELVLKIPWKNIYSAPVIAKIDGLYVVVTPNASQAYNEDKEKKMAKEAKKKELQRIEDAKAREAQKDKDKEQKQDTFTEKLVTQIIRNLQVKILNIHVRYEDNFTNPASPFAVGITLHSLFFETTDENWKPCVIQEAVKMFNKLVTLDSLGVYWNSNVELLSEMNYAERKNAMIQIIASKEYKPMNVSYLLGPISLTAKMILNPKPETDGSNFSIPKVHLDITIEDIAIGMSKSQYQDVIRLLEALDRMALASKYRKYRSNEPYKNNAKVWWKFGVTCVLEEDIRRRKRNWSWEHMQQHRTTCRKYKELYKQNLVSKKVSQAIQQQIDEYENELDIFNITIMRKQAEVDVSREMKNKASQSGGWFSWWFGGGQKAQETTAGVGGEIVKKIDDAMTEQEKAQLYEAIGYQENVVPAEYPKEFIENKLFFQLNNFVILIKDDTKTTKEVMTINLSNVSSSIEHRPSAEAIKVEVQLEGLTINGVISSNGRRPQMVKVEKLDTLEKSALLQVLFETNPLDQLCDQKLNLATMPLEIIYDACTINSLIEVFKPPQTISLYQLQAAATLKLEDFKEQSALGLQYAIEQHKNLDLNIDIKPSYIIIPENGAFEKSPNLLVINLGNFQMQSVKTERGDSVSVKSLVKAGSTDEEVLEAMMTQAYDKFHISIQNISILLSKANDDWKCLTKEKMPETNLLHPVSVDVNFMKAIIADDPRMPKVKISGELPLLNLSVSDHKLKNLMKLAQSIPLPENQPEPKVENIEVTTTVSNDSALVQAKALKQVTRPEVLAVHEEQSEDKEKPGIKEKDSSQFIDLQLNFEIKRIVIDICHHLGGKEKEMISFGIHRLGTSVCMRTFDMSVDLLLGGISLEHKEYSTPDGKVLYLLDTPLTLSESSNLLTLQYVQADKKGPLFTTHYESTVQRIIVRFTQLDIVLHQDALLSLMKFATTLTEELQQPRQPQKSELMVSTSEISAEKQIVQKSKEEMKAFKKKLKDDGIIDIKLDANLSSLGISICTSKISITNMQIRGLDAQVKVLKSKTMLTACLKELLVTDSTMNAVYPNILSTVNGNLLNVDVVVFNQATEDDDYSDMSAVDLKLKVSLGAVKVVFLNRYVSKILNFISKFDTAKEKVAEASVAAAEMAKHGIEDAYEKATRVSLDIHLKAPLIIIPQNFSSQTVLVADLGTLKLCNKFEKGNVTSETGMPAVFDKLFLEFCNLKLSTAIVDTISGNIIGEATLLEPINMSLEVTRNLSIGWFKKVPEMVIKGKLAAVKMIISQEDVTIIMKILGENLGDVEPSDSSLESMNKGTSNEKATNQKEVSVQQHIEEKAKDFDIINPVFKRMTFAFHLDSLMVCLFEGSSGLSSGISKRNSDCALAQFELLTIAMKGEMLSDTSLWANVILVNCILDDKRSFRTKGITRLMQCISTENDIQNMIDITFRQESSLDKFLDARISSFNLIVNLGYLMSLGDFFLKAMPESPQSKPPTTTELKSSVVSDQVVSVPKANTTINLQIKQPDIILIEDMEDYNSNAVILNLQMIAKVRSSPDSQIISGSLSNLQLFTACFNPELRSQTMSEILSPCDISLHASSPGMKGQHVNIEFSSILLNVSPNIIFILTKILSGLSPQQSSEELETIKPSQDYSNLWLAKKLEECSFWFLETLDPAKEISEDSILGVDEVVESEVDSEVLMLKMSSISLTVSIGRGKQTVPMVLIEAGFHAEVQNWSSFLHVGSIFSMEIAYYNEKLALWEPLLEQVEQPVGGSKPWELKMEVAKNPELPEPPSEDGETTEICFQPPVMSIGIISIDVMELTVSKIALEVLTSLGQAFGEAVNQAHGSKLEQPDAPYVVKNNLGIPMSILLNNDGFQVVGQEESGFKEVLLEPDTTVCLNQSSSSDVTESDTSILRKQNLKMEEVLCIKIETDQINIVRKINIAQVGKRYFQLPHKTSPGDQWGFVTDIISSYGSKIITFQSCITVKNHISVPMELYYMRPGGNELEMCGVIEPENVSFVPLYGVYCPTSELFFKPAEGTYNVCMEPFVWKDLVNEPGTSKTLHCSGRNPGERSFYLRVFGEVEQVLFEDSTKRTMISTCYILHLQPTASLRNLLPLIINYTIQGVDEEFVLEEGKTHDLTSADPGKTSLQIKLPSYVEQSWTCSKELNPDVEELTVWTFSSKSLDKELTLDLGMHTRKTTGYLDMEIYCPFWMINKTNLHITYKGEEQNTISHPGNLNIPLLFSFRAKNFFSKKKASLKVEDSDWSDKFAVDAVGSSGSVAAKVKDGKTYCLGVQIVLGQASLTKVVVFTPFYLLTNNCKFDIECKEDLESAHWFTVLAGECVPFWPDQTKKPEMVVRYAGSQDHTAPFSFKEPHSNLLRLAGTKGAIYVDCQVGESSTVLTFCDYYDGSAQVRLVNHTDKFTVEYLQSGRKEKHQLPPLHCILYTWEDPLGKKELTWSCGKKTNEKNSLIQDGIEGFNADKDMKVYWVSFLDGLQRTLMFTEDIALATAAQEAGELERIEQEITISLQGVGISLVDNDSRSEIVYISLANSGVLWEQCKLKSRRYKPVSLKENVIIENGYQKFLKEIKAGKTPKPKQSLESKLEIDYSEMMMYKPNKRNIRRTFQVGLWAQYCTSPHQLQLHAKINKLQVDNQLSDCIFPVVLAPVPLPKSVAADSAPKPFTEVSVMMRIAEHSVINQFKYFKVLIQEFHVKIDQSFINSLISFFSPKEQVQTNHEELLVKDKEVLQKDLKVFATTYSSQEQKSFYDILHFSPIKVHLSFSMTGSSSDSNQPTPIHSDFINLLLQSIGVTVTEIQDVIFKLNFFEKKHSFFTQKQLVSDATMHYTGQALKQLYVLVLGLDVIGNPVGLLLGISEGVGDFFYEPFQGAIQGPEEFAEGLAIGVKSLFGHAVGGAAGAVSRITGTLGKGLAALTMDQEYQKKRRQQMNKRPGDVRQGLAQGGKGFVMGVFEGVTGVVTKPMEGAKEEGVGGFFKGVGKGLIGAVARPTVGAVDLASSGLEAVKKVTELSDEIKRARCPRYIHPDTIIRPYSLLESEGNQLLQEVEKGRFASTDDYVAHLPVGTDGKNHLLVTNRRVMLISRGDIFGQWNTEWQLTWSEIKETPQITEKGIKFLLKEPKKKKLGGLFGGGETGKVVHIRDPQLCTWIVGKIEEAVKRSA